MSYADQAALVGDPDFAARVVAAATEQALIFVDDSRPEFTAPAQQVILATANAFQFVSLVAAQPAMSKDSTDPDILSALQAVWPKYGTALIDQPPTE